MQLANSERKELTEIGAKLGRKALEETATIAQLVMISIDIVPE